MPSKLKKSRKGGGEPEESYESTPYESTPPVSTPSGKPVRADYSSTKLTGDHDWWDPPKSVPIFYKYTIPPPDTKPMTALPSTGIFSSKKSEATSKDMAQKKVEEMMSRNKIPRGTVINIDYKLNDVGNGYYYLVTIDNTVYSGGRSRKRISKRKTRASQLKQRNRSSRRRKNTGKKMRRTKRRN